jgi:hypothetical protein
VPIGAWAFGCIYRPPFTIASKCAHKSVSGSQSSIIRLAAAGPWHPADKLLWPGRLRILDG